MIWMTWRQFRSQATVTAAALAVFAILLAVTGPHAAKLYASSGLPGCHAPADCSRLAGDFLTNLGSSSKLTLFLFVGGIALMYVVPCLIGLFWGAPMIAREIEAGTFRLAWNQSISRTRWLVIKLGLVAAVAMAAAGLLSLAMTWWAAPIDKAGDFDTQSHLNVARISPLLFGARGVAPVGYAAFAVALGVLAGLLIRRTLPAMAVTLAVFAAVQILMPQVVRPHLLNTRQATIAVSSRALNDEIDINSSGELNLQPLVSLPGAWVITNQVINRAGQVFVLPDVPQCRNGSPQRCFGWIAAQHLRQRLRYLTADKFWPLQWLETGIYLILAGALAGCCVVVVRRRSIA